MKVIHKYPFKLYERRPILQMPKGAVILKVQAQIEQICVWALIEYGQVNEDRDFLILGTGEQYDLTDQYKYIDTVQWDEGYEIYHIFEVLEKKNEN